MLWFNIASTTNFISRKRDLYIFFGIEFQLHDAYERALQYKDEMDINMQEF